MPSGWTVFWFLCGVAGGILVNGLMLMLLAFLWLCLKGAGEAENKEESRARAPEGVGRQEIV